MSVSTREDTINQFDSTSDNLDLSMDEPETTAVAAPTESAFLPYFMYGLGIIGCGLLIVVAIFNFSTLTNLFTASNGYELATYIIVLTTAIICNYSLFKVPPGIWLTAAMSLYFACFMMYDALPAGILIALASSAAEILALRRSFAFVVRTTGMHTLAMLFADWVYHLVQTDPTIQEFSWRFVLAALLGFAAYRVINDFGTNVTQLLQGKNIWESFTTGFLRTNLVYLAMLPAAMILAFLKFQASLIAFGLGCMLVVVTSLVLRNFSQVQERSQQQLLEVQKLNEELNRQNTRQVGLGNRINEALDSFLSLVRSYAATSHEQETAVVEITATVEELSRTAAQIAGSADQVAADADHAIETTANGQAAVNDTIEAIREVRQKIQQIAARIVALSEDADKIGSIVTTINSIAGEIRLLALNATIEASGAGQYGRRFAVVAGEVNELADRSRKAVLEIRQLIGEIQSATDNTVYVTQEGLQQMEYTVATVSQSEVSNREIINVVEKTAQAAAAISLATQQQRSASEQVVTSMHDVAIMIGQNAEKVASVSVASLELQRVARELIEDK